MRSRQKLPSTQPDMTRRHLRGHLFPPFAAYRLTRHGTKTDRLADMTALHSRQDHGSAEDGFSLLELMVVVVIMSILALVIVPRVIDRPDQARIARVQSDIAILENALKLYKLDNFDYPTTEQGLTALVEKPGRAPVPENYAANGYIDRLPNDPWGRPYQYLNPGVRGEFDVFSYGANGTTGGSGMDADIGNWSAE